MKLLGTDNDGVYVGLSGWIERHVWGERSAVATWVTDTCDKYRWMPDRLVNWLGTGNFFS